MKHLIFWKGMEENAFKQTDEGVVFFGGSVFGYGRIVTAEQKTQLTASMRKVYTAATVALFGALLGKIVLGWYILLIVLPVLAVFVFRQSVYTRRLLRDAPISRHSMKFGEPRFAVARQLSNARLIALMIINGFFVLMSVFLLVAQPSSKGISVAVGGLILFGIGLGIAVWLAILKWRQPAP
jgi:hypothetical protein